MSSPRGCTGALLTSWAGQLSSVQVRALPICHIPRVVEEEEEEEAEEKGGGRAAFIGARINQWSYLLDRGSLMNINIGLSPALQQLDIFRIQRDMTLVSAAC